MERHPWEREAYIHGLKQKNEDARKMVKSITDKAKLLEIMSNGTLVEHAWAYKKFTGEYRVLFLGTCL